MPHLENVTLERVLYLAVAVVLIYIGLRLGKLFGSIATNRAMAQKEQELFVAQKGFKTLYESEFAAVKGENDKLTAQAQQMTQKVEEYRKKAAGLGGLFSSGGKKADAMYALLLENEALEEALQTQNEKLKQERTDALKEQMRNTSYRRVLMSQLLSDDRIKGYVQEVLADENRLPAADGTKALPAVEAE